MKKKILLILILTVSLSYAFIYKSENSQTNGIVLKFVTHNGYGNNLYIDNVTVGTQYNADIKITSFINLPFDTVYSVGNTNLYIDTVKALVTNVGKTTINSARFILDIPELGYRDTMRTPSLAPKSLTTLTFDSVLFIPNRTYNAKLYLADSIDNNPYNDTLQQSFGYYQGNYKNVLFESFTSATSPASAANNPALNNFVNSKFDSLVSISYHLGFPGPAIDSLYLGDTVDNNMRRDYYNIASVPNLIFNGSFFSGLPFTTETLKSSFDTLKKIGSPLTISVTDTRLTGDSIRTNVSININAPMKAGDYYLRLNVLERKVSYASPPGTNGESVFYDVLRNLFTTQIPSTQGVYNYNFTYVRNSAWVDSMVYSAAFVQDDNTFDVVNSAKSRSGVFERLKNFSIQNSSSDAITGKFAIKPSINSSNSFYKKSNSKTAGKSIADTNSTDFYLEQFETPGLPQGWSLAHLSELFTFENVYNTGINGISYPGNGCMRMNFYSNTDIGQMDTLYSPLITNLTSLDTLRFDYAYAGYLSNEGDSLYIYVSTDGGLTFPTNIFSKGGIGLATSSSSTISFVPTAPNQWRTFVQPLSQIIHDRFSEQVPSNYTLNQNYPNPFNPSTKISFTLPVQSKTLLIIYDMSGRELQRLLDENLTAGFHEINFSGANLASGVYFYKLITPDFVQSKKMVLIK